MSQPTRIHPFIAGNFAPLLLSSEQPLTSCVLISGEIPKEFTGGQYVRNGANPLHTHKSNGKERDMHWFDGDGMLCGVLFRRNEHESESCTPMFVNRFVRTDLFLDSIANSRTRPIIPSIATLITPHTTLSRIRVLFIILRSVFLILLTHIFPWQRNQKVKKISAANVSVIYHAGRALASCDSGPPMRVALPGLDTIGWFNGVSCDGEPDSEYDNANSEVFGGDGVFKFLKEWTTGHPRVDRETNDLILFHNTFLYPYVHYGIIPSSPLTSKVTNHPIHGMSSPKLMHDFGVSHTHTIILDLPLSLSPLNLLTSKPVVHFDKTQPSRFGVFPRWRPEEVKWFEEQDGCVVFHTANTWDDEDGVNMLVCRMNTAALVYAAANLPTPPSEDNEKDECRLHYYRFPLSSSSSRTSHSFPLTPIPIEYPSVSPLVEMKSAQFVYGCSTRSPLGFDAHRDRGVKIDCLIKVDVSSLIRDGKSRNGRMEKGECADVRSAGEILASQETRRLKGEKKDEAIAIFPLPEKWYAQEPRFIPCHNGTSEDDGYLIFYVFDESQLRSISSSHSDIEKQPLMDVEEKELYAPPGAKSELWILSARDMRTIVARIRLPQRVPYGFHGAWFPQEEVEGQRDWSSTR